MREREFFFDSSSFIHPFPLFPSQSYNRAALNRMNIFRFPSISCAADSLSSRLSIIKFWFVIFFLRLPTARNEKADADDEKLEAIIENKISLIM